MASNHAVAKGITVVSAVVILVISGGLLYLDPVYLGRMAAWVLGGVLLLACWIFFELAGDRIFGAKVFSRMSSGARVLLAVPIMLALMVVGYFAMRGIDAVVRWGQ